jgi:two-component system, NarL family, nitrate/nitrite response regulator NarL
MKPCQEIYQAKLSQPRHARLLIVSDVFLYREGLSAALAQDSRVEIAGKVSRAEAIAEIAVLAPDAVLLDASLAEGLALARQIRCVAPAVRVVGFGIDTSEEGILACAEAGLAGFVGRDGKVEELATAVDLAICGELRCSPRIASLLFDRVASFADKFQAAPIEASLTRREREIAALIEQGLSNKEIAIELRIGFATVKNHVHNILEKLQLRRRSGIMARLRYKSS